MLLDVYLLNRRWLRQIFVRKVKENGIFLICGTKCFTSVSYLSKENKKLFFVANKASYLNTKNI